MSQLFQGITEHEYGSEVRCQSLSKEWVAGYMQCMATRDFVEKTNKENGHPSSFKYTRKYFVISPDGTKVEVPEMK